MGVKFSEVAKKDHMYCLFDCCIHRDLVAGRGVKGIFEYYENGGESALKEKKERKRSCLLTVDKS